MQVQSMWQSAKQLAQWRHSVKTRLYNTLFPYLIVLASSVKTKEVKVIEFHRIVLDLTIFRRFYDPI